MDSPAVLRCGILGLSPCYHFHAVLSQTAGIDEAAPQPCRALYTVDMPDRGNTSGYSNDRFNAAGGGRSLSEDPVWRIEFRRLFSTGHKRPTPMAGQFAGSVRTHKHFRTAGNAVNRRPGR